MEVNNKISKNKMKMEMEKRMKKIAINKISIKLNMKMILIEINMIFFHIFSRFIT